jgi:hypothetical protein
LERTKVWSWVRMRPETKTECTGEEQ